MAAGGNQITRRSFLKGLSLILASAPLAKIEPGIISKHCQYLEGQFPYKIHIQFRGIHIVEDWRKSKYQVMRYHLQTLTDKGLLEGYCEIDKNLVDVHPYREQAILTELRAFRESLIQTYKNV